MAIDLFGHASRQDTSMLYEAVYDGANLGIHLKYDCPEISDKLAYARATCDNLVEIIREVLSVAKHNRRYGTRANAAESLIAVHEWMQELKTWKMAAKWLESDIQPK